MVCMQWLPGGRTPLGQYGDVPLDRALSKWCQSTESRHTRHKRAIIKRLLISTNRSIHPYIIQIRTTEKLSFLDLITGRHNTVLV